MMNEKLKNWTIILDDGHGVSTPGKRSPLFNKRVKSGNRIFEPGDCFIENWVNRPVTNILHTLLEGEGIQVFQTAFENEDIKLSERKRRENKIAAACKATGKHSLFLSIHADAFEPINVKTGRPELIWNPANGSTAFYFEKGDKHSAEGKKLAEIICQNLVDRNGLDNRGARGANFFVLRETISVGCLVELGFMTNEVEVLKLDDPVFHSKCAIGLKEGIFEYISDTSV